MSSTDLSDDRLRPDANNLTLVRLVLASAVIWTHSYWRVTGRSGEDELFALLGAAVSSYAVDGFFFLSGFLVYRSLAQRGSVMDFARARLTRLWPALAVAVLLTAGVGGLLTDAPLNAYWRGDTLRFVVANLSLLSTHYTLTGVRCGSELCNVNGSLWTITWEVRCYILLGLLALAGLAQPRWMQRIILPLSGIGALGLHVPGVAWLLGETLGDAVVYNLSAIDRLWTMFALGIAAYLWREHIRLSWTVLALLLAGTLATAWLDWPLHIRSLFIGYGVLCAGFMRAGVKTCAEPGAPLPSLSGRWPDYSYGVYIYAFPVMMLLAATLPFSHHALLALANIIATLPLAALSWHLIEKPALDRVRTARRRARNAAANAIS